MMTDNKRRSNRNVALMVMGGMIILAAITTLFTLATVEWRRRSDTMRPDMPSFGRSLLTSLAIFVVVVAILGAIALWINRSKQ